MTTDRKNLTLAYLEAVAQQRYGDLENMFVPALQFRGPITKRHTAQDFIGALKRLGVIHVRNDVRHVFVDGDDVCVIYDFVTSSTAGALPTIEWLHFEGSRIRAIDLFYDQLPWQTVMAEMTERAKRAGQAVA